MQVTATRQDEIGLDLLRSVMRSYRAVPLLYPAVTGAFAIWLESAYSPLLILAWWLTIAALQVDYALFQHRFFRDAHDDAEGWTNAAAWRYALMNTVWVGMVPLFWQSGNEIQNLGLILVQIVHVVSTSMTASSRRAVFYACSGPTTIASVAGCLVADSPTFQALGIGFAVTYLYLARMARQSRLSAEDALKLRLDNTVLIADLAAARDISEAARSRAEEANAELSRREERFRALVENAFDGIVVTDLDNIITYASPSVRSIGFRPEDMIGRSTLSFLQGDEADRVRDNLNVQGGRTQMGQHLEFHTRRADGKVHWFEASVTDLRADPNVEGYVLNLRDITERKRSQTELVGQFRVLEALAAGASIDDVMLLVAKGAEETNPSANVAVYLTDEALRLTVCASPSFPPSFREAVETFWEENKNRAFGHAVAASTERLVIRDLLADGNDEATKNFARTFGVRALWLQNILSANGKGGIGAIALYLKEPRAPSVWEQACLLGTAQLASIAVTRRRAEQDLREATQTAELANRAKTKFLANMSHELRTPLNAIIGFSEIMRDELFGPIGSARYAEYAKDINDSGAHLLSVIDDILDISKIEAGRYALEEQDMDLAEVLHWSMEIVRPRTAEKQLSLILDTEPDLPLVHADVRAMRQIMLNLLSNAAKFTPRLGRIAIAARIGAGGDLELSVSDTGIGIPADKLDEVMEPFGQVDDTTARQHGGTGLGLSITKSLAELHNGRFRLESVFGEGTTATLILPAARLRHPARKKAAAD
ncbi:MAG: PAS domain S-box protein [Parvibaculum sp.]|uniref:sensor histidine kinase n=1 Tax=Parvibaculum sp. TaxID=2024848 RepID=UPI0025E553E0|nr:PAS domain-containing hybrid sensor histidine kinase/response regulator [Parvibaculum sp.]MCE9651203.1 PAS domain S-box protein [Parvibaculum sp.]